MEEEAKQYTAFTVGSLWFYECNRMPFGLNNAPATFQRLMQRVLGDLHLNGCVVYIDDLNIYTKTEKEHEDMLEKVFQRIREAGLKLSPKKCRFFQREIKCLGHAVPRRALPAIPARLLLSPNGLFLQMSRICRASWDLLGFTAGSFRTMPGWLGH